MGFKLNNNLINVEPLIEDIKDTGEITEAAQEAVTSVITPIVVPQTVINFLNNTNLNNPTLSWFGSGTRAVSTATYTQIKPDCGFKIYLPKDSNITFTFFTGYAENFSLTYNGTTVDGHNNQITINYDQWLELKAKNGSAYIIRVVINNRIATINEALVNKLISPNFLDTTISGSIKATADDGDIYLNSNKEIKLSSDGGNNTGVQLSIEPSNLLLGAKDYFNFDSGNALVSEASMNISAYDMQVTLDLPENEDRGQSMTKNTSFSLAGENTVFSVNTVNKYGYNQAMDADNSINSHISMWAYDNVGSHNISNSKIELYIGNNDNDTRPESKIELKPEAITVESSEAITIEGGDNKLRLSQTNGLQFSPDSGTTNYSLTKLDLYAWEFSFTDNGNTIRLRRTFVGPEWITGKKGEKTLNDAQTKKLLIGTPLMIIGGGSRIIGSATTSNAHILVTNAAGNVIYTLQEAMMSQLTSIIARISSAIFDI